MDVGKKYVENLKSMQMKMPTSHIWIIDGD